MPRRDVSIEIFAPNEGLVKNIPQTMLTLRATPNVADCNYFYGMIQKDYGTTLFCTGSGGVGTSMGSPVTLIYQAQFPPEATLQAFTQTGMYKYSSGLNAFVTDGQVYTGTVTDFWSACMHNAAMVYANGANLVQYKASYNTTGTDMGGVATDSYKAWCVVSFANHLNLYHTVEAGNECNKRVRWSKAGLLGLTGTDWNSGTAGFVDIQDADGDIVTAAKLGNSAVAIYSENSIHMQEWVGEWDVYRFTKYITNKGCRARRGVAVNDAVHYFISEDNIYEYLGGRDLRPIGDAIKPYFINEVNHSALHYSWCEYIKEDDELRVHVPTGTNTHPDKVLVCKIKENYAWYENDQPYTGWGVFTRPSALTIGELVGDIGAQNWRFGDLIVNAGSPIHLRGDASGRVVKRDKTVYSLNVSGTAVPQNFIFDTKDISSITDTDPVKRSTRRSFEASQYMDTESRWLKLKVEAKGSGYLHLQYSTDAGNTFTTYDESPLLLDADWDMYEVDFDRANPNCMVRFTNAATNEVVHLRYIKLQFVPGGEVG